MALRTADDDPVNNPGDNYAKGLFKREKQGSMNGQPITDDVSKLNDAEEKGTTVDTEKPSYKNSVLGRPNDSSTPGGIRSWLWKNKRTKGPMLFIATAVLVGGFGLATFFSPGLLLVQIKEMMVNKFNVQSTSMSMRETRILKSKFTGIGNSKYSSLSDYQIQRLKRAGITIEGGKKTKFGLTKPEGFKFNGGDTIKVGEFETTLGSNLEIRSAFKAGYSSKFAGFADGIWNKAMNYLKISKSPPIIEGENFDEKLSTMEKDLKQATGVKETPLLTDKDIDPATGKPYSNSEAGVLGSANEEIGKINGLVEVAAEETSATSKILNGVSETIKVTGPVDALCTVYRTTMAVGYAAKTVRVMQLAFYAMMFLNVADQIKAGVAKADDVSFLGTVLTQESRDDNGVAQSATDSFGYKYAAYNEVGVMPSSATMFMAGAGFSGLLVNILDAFTPSVLSKTCKVLGNPVVGLASIVIGVAALFTGAGEVKTVLVAAGKEALKSKAFWTMGALALGEMFLPNILKDILAGNLIDSSTIGGQAGDALTSGASGMMGTSAKYGGNAPLTPKQAVAYNNLSNTIAAQNAEEDRLALSPFDITNSNTFMGSIVAKLIPYASKMSSLSGALSSVASLTTGSLASITSQITNADNSSAQYEMCQDYQYRKLDVATDPYCNIVYGIPVDELNADPVKVAAQLGATNIDPITGDPKSGSDYEKFISECINRTTPLGDFNDSVNSSGDGSNCFYNKTFNGVPNGNYYIHYIDQRVQKGMDGEDPVLAAAEASGQTGISFYSNSNYNTTAVNTGSK